MSARRFLIVEGSDDRGVVVAEGVRFDTGHVVVLAEGPRAQPMIYGSNVVGQTLDGMDTVARSWPRARVTWVDSEPEREPDRAPELGA
jgi:hypothetical protein